MTILSDSYRSDLDDYDYCGDDYRDDVPVGDEDLRDQVAELEKEAETRKDSEPPF